MADLILHHYEYGWLFPFLLWPADHLLWISITVATMSMRFVWNHTGICGYQLLPVKVRIPLAAFDAWLSFSSARSISKMRYPKPRRRSRRPCGHSR